MKSSYGKGWRNEPLRHSLARKGIKTGRKNKLDFPKGKGNSVHTVIIVPSTKNFDEPISKAEHKKRAEEVKKFVSEELETDEGSGFTEIKGSGGWVEKGKVVEEPVKEVHNYTTPQVWKEKDLVVKAFIEKKKHQWGQSAIGFQHEETLHFIK
jgi:hypothetical protein